MDLPVDSYELIHVVDGCDIHLGIANHDRVAAASSETVREITCVHNPHLSSAPCIRRSGQDRTLTSQRARRLKGEIEC